MLSNNNKIESIVLLADRTYTKSEESDIDSNRLEMVCDEYFEDIFNGLSKIAGEVIHYNTPQNFIDNIKKHKNAIIFSIYGGFGSRNRMALVPAICESYNIRYVGGDTYARIICQDKQLTKEFVKKIGLSTPGYILVEEAGQLDLTTSLKLPLIIKPNMEGSSIGIDRDSIAHDYSTAIHLAKKGLIKYAQPILVEEFVGGREVNICITGDTKNIQVFEAIENYHIESPAYFDSNVFSAYDKHVSDDFRLKTITSELKSDTIQLLKKLFLSLGKMDYLRIDGKLSGLGFQIIELTPDGYIGKDSAFAVAYSHNNIDYNKMLLAIIDNSLAYYQTQYSSDKGN